MSKTKEQIYGEHYHKWEHSNNELSTHIIEAMQEFSTQELAAFKDRLKKACDDIDNRPRTNETQGNLVNGDWFRKLIDQTT